MNEQNIFLQSEMEMRPPPHANNCHGHKTSIAAGGNGHYSGDSCGCDTFTPSAPIDGWIWLPLLVALVMIWKVRKHSKVC